MGVQILTFSGSHKDIAVLIDPTVFQSCLCFAKKTLNAQKNGQKWPKKVKDRDRIENKLLKIH